MIAVIVRSSLSFFIGAVMQTVPKTNTYPVTRRRLLIVAVAFSLFLCYLFVNLFRLQYIQHDYYKNKVYDQITTTAPLKAQRGTIYDSHMNVLATTQTTWRVFISTTDIKKKMKEDSKAYDICIAEGLANILSVDKTALLEKIRNTHVLDVTVKKSIDAEVHKTLLDFIQKEHLEDMVFTEAQNNRYYPQGTMFAHVLGFTGSDNQGLYGLEYSYDKTLSGKDGYYLYAKDANGNALPTEYASYVPAEDGYSIVTTLDSYIQEVLESTLETIRVNHQVQNRVTGIVMNTETGAILAMATSSPFDPNDPYTLDAESAKKLEASGLTPGSDEYVAMKKELLSVMWSNKAVSETYEPGSTFKIVTVATALDLGVADMDDRFSCVGYHTVGGWHIRCHKAGGHGQNFNLAYGLQMSCNPTMMNIAERIGADNFYQYVEAFGYLSKTGIDLPSEAGSIFHKQENIGPTELATASFGQRFKVSVIRQLTSIAAVANGGVSVTPHVMEKVIGKDGNTVMTYTAPQGERIISEEVARQVSEVLEAGVSGDGGAKNAGVDGYKIAAKTGTSQKFDNLDANGNSYLRIGSTVAYAPSDESGIAVIIVVDEPTSAVKYGSVVAAPYVSEIYESILPYLSYQSNAEKQELTLDNYVGMQINTVKKKLSSLGIACRVVGEGDVVLSQVPSANITVSATLSEVILYTVERTDETTVVPDLVGKTLSEANQIATNLGLSLHIIGLPQQTQTSQWLICAQSLPPGDYAKRNDMIAVRAISYEHED